MLTCPLNLLLNLMEVMEAEWSSKVWTKLKLFCTSKTWISRSRPAEASNLWPTSEEKRLPRVRKFSLKWESELSFTYPISNSPLTPKEKKTLEIRQQSNTAYFSLLKRPSKRFKFSPSLGYIFLRALHRYPRVYTQVLTVICNLQYSLWNSWRFPREITSEERAQKFHTDDVSLPSVPHWSCRQICVNQSEALPRSG